MAVGRVNSNLRNCTSSFGRLPRMTLVASVILLVCLVNLSKTCEPGVNSTRGSSVPIMWHYLRKCPQCNVFYLPMTPPLTTIGSFDSIISSFGNQLTRDVFIYWNNINEDEKCHKTFKYCAYYTAATNDNTPELKVLSKSTYANHAMFLGLNTTNGYNFTVYSVNPNGQSTDYSTIYVPGLSDELDIPSSLTRTEPNKPGLFELSWINSASIQFTTPYKSNYYTLFWCEVEKDYPYQCNGHMNWTRVSRLLSRYTINLSNQRNKYQFAISANSKVFPDDSHTALNRFTVYTTGMIWESCVPLHNRKNGKIKNFWPSVISGTYAAVRWKLDCVDTIGLIKEYNLMICPLESICINSECIEPMTNKTVSLNKPHIKRYFEYYFVNLQPSTSYMTAVTIITKFGASLHSDFIRFTTLLKTSQDN